MSSDARANLATRQAELVSALAGSAAPPAGFDADRLHAAGTSLANKRRRAVARAWATLVDELGDRFEEEFARFAAATPLPRHGGPLADGRAFVRWLGASADLGSACRLQALQVDLRYSSSPDGLLLRRGPALKVLLLRRPRRLVTAWRLPWLGERWLTVPLG